ncbi:MAG: radical SAM protein [Clostridiales bacterium]|nr:radical SAM protein [Clostridiales bacterium]
MNMNMNSKVYAYKMILLLQNPDRIVDVKSDSIYPVNHSMLRVMRSIGRGASISEIADRLKISDKAEQIKVLNKTICMLIESGILTTHADQAGGIFIKHPFSTPALEKITMETTRKCNFRCKHCYNSSDIQGSELSQKKIESIIELANRLGVYRIDLTGGEFFVRSDAFDILECMKSHGMIVNVFTNGFLLNDDQLNIISEMEFIRNFYISLDDNNAEKHDAMRNMQGAFEKTVKTIQELSKMGKRVIVNCTITNDNINRMKEIYDYFTNELHVKFRMAPLLNMGRAENMNKIHIEQYIDNIRSLGLTPELMDDLFVSPTADINIPHCGIGSNMIYMMADGTLVPCPLLRDKEFYLGNILQNDLKNLWPHHELLTKIRSSICNSNCEYLEKCRGGCKSRAYFRHNRFDAADPVSCSLFPK